MQSTAFCSMRLVKAIFFLGSVDILAQPNQGTGELQKPKITTGQFVEARKDTPKMLDFADKALNQMPFAVAPIIIFSWLFSVDFRRDDHFNALGDEFHDKTLCCITTVGNQRLKVQVNYHIMRLEDVMALTGGQGQAQRIAQAINCHMNFGAKPASAAPQSLFSLSTVFWGLPQRRHERVQWYCPPSHFPYLGQPQNTPTCAPTPRCRTSAQSACRHCSNARIRWAAVAIAPRYGQPIRPPRQIHGILVRYQHTLAGLLSKIPALSSIVRPSVSWLSCDNLSLLLSNVNRT